jgi:hypothetical protein
MDMKKIVILLLLGISVVGSACSLNEEAAELYRKEQPLKADIILPADFSDPGEESIEVALTQNGGKIENPDYVHFEVWKQDGSLHFPMEEAEAVGGGIYRISKQFDQDGLYFVQVHAANDGSIIIPKKQFIVGELSKGELEFLQKGAKPDTPVEEHHH